jgi:anti-sigma B factor antagonist
MRIPGRKRRKDPEPPAGPPLPLEVGVSAADYGVLVTIAGELDIATAPRVRAALTAHDVAGGEAVVADLSDVKFMDSTGLSLFLTLEGELRERGGRLAIACPEGAARLIFDVTGVDEHLKLYPSRDAAEAALAHGLDP